MINGATERQAGFGKIHCLLSNYADVFKSGNNMYFIPRIVLISIFNEWYVRIHHLINLIPILYYEFF